MTGEIRRIIFFVSLSLSAAQPDQEGSRGGTWPPELRPSTALSYHIFLTQETSHLHPVTVGLCGPHSYEIPKGEASFYNFNLRCTLRMHLSIILLLFMYVHHGLFITSAVANVASNKTFTPW